jgi:hypothetical protein
LASRLAAGDDLALAEADHVGSTQPWATRQAGQPPASTRTQWRGAADRSLALAREHGDLSAAVALHGMRLTWARC